MSKATEQYKVAKICHSSIMENPNPIDYGEGFLEILVMVFLEAMFNEAGDLLSNVAHL